MTGHSRFLEHWNSQKSVSNIWQRFSCLLDEGIPKYGRNWILTMAFWATCKIAQPIQPIWQHIFALPWSAFKKPPWEFNFFHIFGVPLSSRHEKHCQMLQTLFWLFQCSKTHGGYFTSQMHCSSARGRSHFFYQWLRF